MSSMSDWIPEEQEEETEEVEEEVEMAEEEEVDEDRRVWDGMSEKAKRRLLGIAEKHGFSEDDWRDILAAWRSARSKSRNAAEALKVLPGELDKLRAAKELEELPPLELRGESSATAPPSPGAATSTEEAAKTEEKVSKASKVSKVEKKLREREAPVSRASGVSGVSAGVPVPVEPKTALELIDAEGIPRHFARIFRGPDGKETPYILKAGLLWKAERLFGKGNYSVRAEPVKWSWQEPLEPLRSVFRGVVEVYNPDGSVRAKFEDYGIADTANVRNRQMLPNIDHLAATRATNRALRLATACGFVSVEEREEVSAADTEVVT